MIIVRKLKVDRTRTRQQAIHATGRVDYINDEVVGEMPIGEGEEKEVFLIPSNEPRTLDQLEQKFGGKRFALVDPVTLCALNEQDPTLADEYPNATQWRDKNGKVCYALFSIWHGSRGVSVDQGDELGSLFFVWVHKKSTQISES